MRRYSRIWTVYRKELTETLRDRRTLMAMVFVPVILYPVLMVVLMQALSSEKGRQEESEYSIVVPDEAHKRWLDGVLAREDAEQAADAAAMQAAAKRLGGDAAPTGEAAFRTQLGSKQIHVYVADDPGRIWNDIANGKYHAAVIVRPDPKGKGDVDPNRVVQVLYSDTNPLSEVIDRQLNRIFADEAGRIVRERVTELAGSTDVLNPIVTTNLSTTSPDKQFSKVLALIVPFLLVTMTVTGAMYPSIDLTAGERERGTLETLAVSPVPVGQIVAGKFGVIVTIAMVTTTLNLASMTAVIHFSGIGKLVGAASSSAGAELEEMHAEQRVESQPAEPGSSAALQRIHIGQRRELEKEASKRTGFVLTAAPIVLLAMIPFAVLFGGVMLAVCSFAKSFKEAQNYMMPVMMSAIVPAMVVSYMPTIELRGPLMAVPVANVVLLMRELFLGNFRVDAVVIVLTSTCLYAAAAVAMATRIYGNESVLFSDVGSYKTLLLRKFMRPQRVPSAAFALLTLALIFPVNFFVQSSIVTPDSGWREMVRAIVITQILLFFGAVVFLAWYTKLDLRETFSLRLPTFPHWVATALIVIGVVPLSATIQQYLYATFEPTAQMREMMQVEESLLTGVPFWALILAFAILPGICEEFAFRGMLLSGLRDRLGGWRTVVLVGIIFGAFHIYVFKIPPVAILGMVLAFVCLRTRSIIPGILIHMANNGFGVIAGKLAADGDTRLMDFYGLPTGIPAPGDYSVDFRAAMFILAVIVGLAILAVRPRRADTEAVGNS